MRISFVPGLNVQRTTLVAETDATASGTLSGDGDVVKWFNTEVCKTSIHRFESGRRLHPQARTSPLSHQRTVL
jgi:hypothetical protein